MIAYLLTKVNNFFTELYVVLKQIANDTLKKGGKWSRTSLTMFVSFHSALFMAFYHLFTVGFDFGVFTVFMTAAGVFKSIDVYDKHKSNPIK